VDVAEGLFSLEYEKLKKKVLCISPGATISEYQWKLFIKNLAVYSYLKRRH
jgi:hypothetical protein